MLLLLLCTEKEDPEADTPIQDPILHSEATCVQHSGATWPAHVLR